VLGLFLEPGLFLASGLFLAVVLSIVLSIVLSPIMWVPLMSGLVWLPSAQS